MSAEPSVPDPEATTSEPDSHALHDETFTCPNCGEPNSGKYCTCCGQKRLHDGDLSLKHAWHHVLHETLHLDGKIFATMKSLFTEPGQIALDFIEGRRARHVHPLGLFLFLSTFFVLASTSALNTHTIMSRSAPPGSRVRMEGANPGVPNMRIAGPQIEARIHKKAEQAGVPDEVFIERLDHRLALAFKMAYTLAIVANGFWLSLLFRRRFRYLAEHMVFALYSSCFGMITNVVVGRINHWLWNDAGTITGALLLLNYGYFVLAARRVYGESWLRITLKGVVPLLLANVIMIGAITVVFAAALR
jgi:hypothetical protein